MECQNGKIAREIPETSFGVTRLGSDSYLRGNRTNHMEDQIMGAGANSSRNKALNDRKERAAGRQDDRGPAQEAIEDAGGVEPGKGKGQSGGSFGKEGQANRQPGNALGEGGGGGGGAPTSDLADVNRSSKPAKKHS